MSETEGGMSGGSGEAGFSTAGSAQSSSSASEGAPPEPLGFDPDGAVFGPVPVPQSIIEGVAHIVGTLEEAAHLIHSGTTGLAPIIIIPHVLEPETQPGAEFDTDTDDDGIEG